MGVHLTPTELAREVGLGRRDVILKCMELGVPIFQGRIDKTLFLRALEGGSSEESITAEADHFTLLDADGHLIDSFKDSAAALDMLQRILGSEPEAEGRVALIAYDASGHPLGTLKAPGPAARV